METNTRKDATYTRPEIEIIPFLTESVICQSITDGTLEGLEFEEVEP